LSGWCDCAASVSAGVVAAAAEVRRKRRRLMFIGDGWVMGVVIVAG
jgi:hypothetical protein